MSIKSEITRLVSAKKEFADYLSSHGVTVPNGTLLGDMVALLSNLSTGVDLPQAASIDVTKGTGVTATSCYLFSHGTLTTGSASASTIPCAVGDLVILTVSVNGGSTKIYATPEISVSSDLATSTAYLYSSNSLSTNGVGVFLVTVNGSGSVSLSRHTGSGSIM